MAYPFWRTLLPKKPVPPPPVGDNTVMNAFNQPYVTEHGTLTPSSEWQKIQLAKIQALTASGQLKNPKKGGPLTMKAAEPQPYQPTIEEQNKLLTSLASGGQGSIPLQKYGAEAAKMVSLTGTNEPSDVAVGLITGAMSPEKWLAAAALPIVVKIGGKKLGGIAAAKLTRFIGEEAAKGIATHTAADLWDKALSPIERADLVEKLGYAGKGKGADMASIAWEGLHPATQKSLARTLEDIQSQAVKGLTATEANALKKNPQLPRAKVVGGGVKVSKAEKAALEKVDAKNAAAAQFYAAGRAKAEAAAAPAMGPVTGAPPIEVPKTMEQDLAKAASSPRFMKEPVVQKFLITPSDQSLQTGVPAEVAKILTAPPMEGGAGLDAAYVHTMPVEEAKRELVLLSGTPLTEPPKIKVPKKPKIVVPKTGEVPVAPEVPNAVNPTAVAVENTAPVETPEQQASRLLNPTKKKTQLPPSPEEALTPEFAQKVRDASQADIQMVDKSWHESKFSIRNGQKYIQIGVKDLPKDVDPQNFLKMVALHEAGHSQGVVRKATLEAEKEAWDYVVAHAAEFGVNTTDLAELLPKLHPEYGENAILDLYIKPKVADDIVATTLKTHGSTYELDGTNLMGEDMYSIGMYPDRELILDRPVTAKDIKQYAFANSDVLKNPRHVIGTWVKDGTGETYLDVSVTRDSFDTALDLGRQTNQEAIFYLKDGTTFNVQDELAKRAAAKNPVPPQAAPAGAGGDAPPPTPPTATATPAPSGKTPKAQKSAAAKKAAAKRPNQHITELKYIDLLEQDKEVYGKSKELIAEARQPQLKQRLARVGDIMDDPQLNGDVKLKKIYGAMKGEYKIPDTTSLAGRTLTDDEKAVLLDKIWDAPNFDRTTGIGITRFDKLTAAEGLMKTFRGIMPEWSELEKMNLMFSDDVIFAILKKRSAGSKFLTLTSSVINLPKALKASMDLSATLRQGFFFTFAHPRIAMEGMDDSLRMYKNFLKDDYYKNYLNRLRTNPHFQQALDADLALYDLVDTMTVAKRDEQYMVDLEFVAKVLEHNKGGPLAGEGSKLAAKVLRGVNIPIEASNRAFNAYLNTMRLQLFSDQVEMLARTGVKLESKEGRAAMRMYAALINEGSGRGTLGKRLDRLSPFLNAIFFSPRYQAATFEWAAAPYTMFKLDKNAAGKVVGIRQKYPGLFKFWARNTGTALGTTAGIVYLAYLAGARVDMNPRSTTFGQIQVGNLKVNPWGNLQSWARYFAQMAPPKQGGQMQWYTGAKTSGQGNRLNANRIDLTMSQIRGKTNPTIGAIWSLMDGKDMTGKAMSDYTAGDWANNLLTPMIGSDVYEAMTKEGIAAGGITLTAGALGYGTQTYEIADSAVSEVRGELTQMEADLQAIRNQVAEHGLKALNDANKKYPDQHFYIDQSTMQVQSRAVDKFRTLMRPLDNVKAAADKIDRNPYLTPEQKQERKNALSDQMINLALHVVAAQQGVARVEPNSPFTLPNTPAPTSAPSGGAPTSGSMQDYLRSKLGQ